jgi:hypothetical protein
MPKYIALDGDKNGLYLNAEQAAENSYDQLIVWNSETGEQAWLHVTSTDDIPAEFVYDEGDSYD